MKLHIYSILVLFFVFTIPQIAIGQDSNSNLEAIKFHLKNQQNKLSLSDSDLTNMNLYSSYLSPTTGWYHAYFNQSYKDIEVYNGILNVAIKDGHLIHTGNSFVPNIEHQLRYIDAKWSLTAQTALKNTVQSLSQNNLKDLDIIVNSSEKNFRGEETRFKFVVKSLSSEPVEVKLYWLLHNVTSAKKTISKISLVWSVGFLSLDKQNAWEAHVDANSGEIIKIIDNVIKCEFGHKHIDKNQILECNNLNTSVSDSKIVNSSNLNRYRVFNYPLESPSHGSRSLVVDPYNIFAPLGTGPGTTNGWHDDGSTVFTDTRGNNVYAQEDVDANNTGGIRPNPSNYDFDYPYALGLNTSQINQNAAITNLFFWNNLIHDVLWKMGFDEPSGNFQTNNLNRGGIGNDFVFADAQDGSGTNNANFYTPIDGSNPRMQMFLWNFPSNYQADSDFDNAVIAHEYGHGWSIRLTGGPDNVSCLRNIEQGGEGWSDYLGLMLTTDWASLTPSVASANIPRGIGTYLFGQNTNGLGIRPFPYSYDIVNVNPTVTYGAVSNTSFSQPHGIGSIWCTILWDMTWQMILHDNAIEPNIFNTNNMVGNVAALKLVNEGLRLQPCSPSFVDARDAILAADQVLFNGRYNCAIGAAFARRGLGRHASTGTSSNDRVVTESFTPLNGNFLSSPINNSVCSGIVFNYTATSSTPGTTFSWERSQVVGISNPSATGNSGQITETLINTTNNAIDVLYTFYFSPNGCGQTDLVVQTVRCTVYPSLIQPIVSNYSVCQNSTVPQGEGLAMPETNQINTITSQLTNTDPTFARPYNLTNGYYYKVFTFVPQTSGVVSLRITQGSFDTYMYLYSNTFLPNSPTSNLLSGDDDSGGNLLSRINYNVIAGNVYQVVITSFSLNEIGTFTLNTNILGFGNSYLWFTNAVGGSSIFTGSVFNPVGVPGSSIANTLTPITRNYYVASLSNPNCRATVTFNVNPATIETNASGRITGSDTVCAIFNSGSLNLINHLGTVLGWEISDDNFATWTTTQTSAATFNYSNLLKTTKYRALLNRGNCQVARSNIALINVTIPVQQLNEIITSDTSMYRSALSINSSQKVFNPSKIHYQAGKNIELNEGFEARSGSNFKAEIFQNDCYIPVVLSLQPDSSNSQDLDISNLFPNQNFANNRYMVPYNWSQFGNVETRRTLIKFDLSSIPSNAVIDSAHLSIYYSQRFVDENPPFNGHFGANTLEIRRITQDWVPLDVNWNNQPTSTTDNMLAVSASTSQTQDYQNMNVKNLVSDQVQNVNYGFLIKHQNESPFKISSFASSEETIPSIRPKLVVYYRFL
jgi:hypothetical protein